MKIRILKNLAGIGYGYFQGQIIDCPDDFAMKLIEIAMAIPVQSPVLPEDFPAREILMENDLNSIEEIKAFGIKNLSDLNGIGRKTVEYIENYIRVWYD